MLPALLPVTLALALATVLDPPDAEAAVALAELAAAAVVPPEEELPLILLLMVDAAELDMLAAADDADESTEESEDEALPRGTGVTRELVAEPLEAVVEDGLPEVDAQVAALGRLLTP